MPIAYRDESGDWMLKFTINGISPMMVATILIPDLPQTGDMPNIMLYAAMLLISTVALAMMVKKRRIE